MASPLPPSKIVHAAEHSEEVNAVLLKEMKVFKIELDELWTFVQKNSFENGPVRG